MTRGRTECVGMCEVGESDHILAEQYRTTMYKHAVNAPLTLSSWPQGPRSVFLQIGQAPTVSQGDLHAIADIVPQILQITPISVYSYRCTHPETCT